MKFRFFAGVLGAALLATGCVNTVTGGKTAGVPFVQDRIPSRYELPIEPVYQAARQVILDNGVLVTEGTLYGQTNAVGNMVKTIKGKVDARTVWVRVEQEDPKVTDVTVQARTSSGAADIDLAAEIDKQIYGKLLKRGGG